MSSVAGIHERLESFRITGRDDARGRDVARDPFVGDDVYEGVTGNRNRTDVEVLTSKLFVGCFLGRGKVGVKHVTVGNDVDRNAKVLGDSCRSCRAGWNLNITVGADAHADDV